MNRFLSLLQARAPFALQHLTSFHFTTAVLAGRRGTEGERGAASEEWRAKSSERGVASETASYEIASGGQGPGEWRAGEWRAGEGTSRRAC